PHSRSPQARDLLTPPPPPPPPLRPPPPHPQDPPALRLDERPHRLPVAPVRLLARHPLVHPVRALLEAQEVHHHYRLVRGTGQQGVDLLRGRVDRHRSPPSVRVCRSSTPNQLRETLGAPSPPGRDGATGARATGEIGSACGVGAPRAPSMRCDSPTPKRSATRHTICRSLARWKTRAGIRSSFPTASAIRRSRTAGIPTHPTETVSSSRTRPSSSRSR